MAATRQHPEAPVGAADPMARVRHLLAELGLAGPRDEIRVTPLTGGVASDIMRVDLPGRRLCVKFALPKLKVVEDWRAPVHRNAAEYRWMVMAQTIVPDIVPQLFGCSQAEHGFAMEFVEGPDVVLWKTALLAGAVERGAAARVAAALGAIHAASASREFDRTGFDNMPDFEALRIEPYLRFTAGRHPDLSPVLCRLADGLARADAALVHGDVSPKNILLRKGAPLILDAECATMGDPAFDAAFCLNHLFLKSAHVPAARALLRAEIDGFVATYTRSVVWEPVADLSARVAMLLPALMLARIDGKSPVEYLDAATRDRLRILTRAALADPPQTIADFATRFWEVHT